MRWMGHGSMRAALIYHHATSVRDRSIASALSDLVTTERQTPRKSDEADEQNTGEEDGQAGTLVSAV